MKTKKSLIFVKKKKYLKGKTYNKLENIVIIQENIEVLRVACGTGNIVSLKRFL